jgi:hypothetical protein
VSPSPSKERGKKKKRGVSSLLNTQEGERVKERRSLSYITNSLFPCQGERDKG